MAGVGTTVLRDSILAVLARSPLLVVGLLAMIVGFHFWGAPGFWAVFIAFLLFNVLMGRRERESAAGGRNCAP